MNCLFIIRHSGNDIIQVFLWVYIVCFTGGQQGTDNRHISSIFVIAVEEIILPSQSYRPDGIFGRIAIPKQASVLQASHHVVPVGIGIRGGFSGLGVGLYLCLPFPFTPSWHP